MDSREANGNPVGEVDSAESLAFGDFVLNRSFSFDLSNVFDGPAVTGIRVQPDIRKQVRGDADQ